MPTFTLADYVTLQDGIKRIDSGFINLSTKLPDDFIPGVRSAKPVLMFKIQAHRESRVLVFVNQGTFDQKVALDFTFGSTNFVRAHHEFVQGDLFTPGKTNKISFTGESGIAEAFDYSISDVLLLFQRKVQF